MEYKSLLNKYKIFEEMPDDKNDNKVIGMFNGKPITRGMDWVVRLVANFEGLCGIECIEEHYDLNFSMLQYCTSHDIHVFRVEEDIIGLLQKTDSKIEYMPSPFPHIFIDGEIKISESIKLFGLFVSDVNEDNHNPDLPNNLFLRGMTKVSYRGREFILPYLNVIGLGKGIILDEEESKYAPKDFHEQVKMFVCSFLHFINHPDVEILSRVYEDKDKIKQESRGKVKKSSLQTIKITGKTKVYLENLRRLFGGKIDWTHSFWVRGHFMRLLSDRYKHKKGEVVWRMPHIRGKGKLIKKEYDVSADEKQKGIFKGVL